MPHWFLIYSVSLPSKGSTSTVILHQPLILVEIWAREVRSVKSALYTVLGTQSVPEEVLMTVLLEVEAILNSKPLGYVSSYVADADPVTPNCLLMGRPDESLPHVVYPESEMLSRHHWRHSQILANQFWSRFIRDYLPSLQTRQKWQSSPPT